MSLLLQKKYYQTIAFALAAILASLFVNVATYYGPYVEGDLLPVANAVRTDITIHDKDTIIVGGVLDKHRDCELLSTAALIEDVAGNRVIVKIEPSNAIILRPPGPGQRWGPWQISVPLWYKKADLLVVTRHQCHPLWQTRTEFLREMIE